MERCAGLIQKLQEDFTNQASPEQLLITLQLLQKELLSQTVHTSYKKSSKVSVVLPNLFQQFATENSLPEPISTTRTMESVITELKEITPAHEAPVLLKVDLSALQEIPVANEISAPEPLETSTHQEITVAPVEKEPAAIPEKQHLVLIDESEDDEEDDYVNIPIIAQQQSSKDTPEIPKETKTDLQEKLQQSKASIGEELLLETPLKDLKKGIGINDRFLFIQELFRGDEIMYERSIKTINGFNIYPEAQYWIERELKIKLGWNDDNDAIQLFYNLVKRRFAVI